MLNIAYKLAKASIRRIDSALAQSLLAKAWYPSWRQYPSYSAIAGHHSGAEQAYWALIADDIPIAIANVRIKRMPLLGWGIAMIAQGPVILQQCDSASDISYFYEVFGHQLSRELGATVRINPSVIHDANLLDDYKRLEASRLKNIHARAYETFIIDLTPDLDVLRANLNGKWRTDLRRGERGDVTIARSTDPDDFRRFQPILSRLSAKKGFLPPQDADFFAEVAQNMKGDEHFAVHLASLNGRIVGGHIGAYSGNMAVYLLGATSDEGRDARASFLLQWEVIKYAKSCELKFYDLGGIDEQGNASVYRFKKRMGGRYYIGPDMLEYRAAWPKGAIVQCAEQIYQKASGYR